MRRSIRTVSSLLRRIGGGRRPAPAPTRSTASAPNRAIPALSPHRYGPVLRDFDRQGLIGMLAQARADGEDDGAALAIMSAYVGGDMRGMNAHVDAVAAGMTRRNA